MLVYSSIFYIFSTLVILSSILVVFSTNPIYSALFLVLSFCNASSLLFCLNLDFLPITFIMVYVGAIVVLFLFVLMMLNIKQSEAQEEKFHYLPLVLILLLIFINELVMLLSSDISSLLLFTSTHFDIWSNFSMQTISNSNLFNALVWNSNIKSIGLLLFVDYYYHFIVVGYILLLAMIASISLTLSKKFISKSQAVYNQVLHSFDKSVINY